MGKIRAKEEERETDIFLYSKVYKARNGKTGKLMALKRIRMKTEKDGVNITY